ncbi:MAG TPA: sulfatase [Candidatus Latescibacteria bacterium]|nr:sulfatase [Candidatus Latescibacterota bacterium]
MARHPSILQITTHDSGRHFGCYGHSTLHTPTIDALAADGVRLTRYFATVPICSASRATQLTGFYPQTHGLMDLCGYPFRWRIRDDVRHMSQLLKAAAYTTHLFGIQHEVVREELPRLEFNSIQGQGFPTAKAIAADVADFLRSRGKEPAPFYAQIGFFQTHTPFDHGGVEPDDEHGVEIPPYLADCESSRRAIAAFQGAIRHVDEAVSVIVEALHESGREDDTIVVFTTDHGIEMPRAKWFLYDPGIAIACIVRYPEAGVTGGGACDLLLSNVDYLPTILDLAAIPAPDGLHGKSFAASLRGECSEPLREAVFALYHKSQSRCVRTNRFSLIRHFDAPIDFAAVPVRFEEVLAKRGISQVELFDLETDPNQFENVADKLEHEDVRARLDTMLWEWMESVDDPLLKGPVRTPSYEAAMGDYRAWRGSAGT